MYLMLIVRLLVPGSAFGQALGTPVARIVAGVLFLLCSVGYAGVFAKAGEPRAKAFAPALNVFTAFKVSGAGTMLFAAYAASLILGIVFAQVASLAMALALFFYAYHCFRLSAAFGKDIPAAAALLLAEPLYALLLGFGRAVYGGPAKPAHPFQPFNVDRYLSDDGPLDSDLKLKDRYREEYGRK